MSTLTKVLEKNVAEIEKNFNGQKTLYWYTTTIWK